MDRYRLWTPVCLLLAAALAMRCGPIPDDTVSSGTDQSSDRVYVDNDWGFQIAIPDAAVWGWTSQTFYQSRESNGLPRVELRMTRQPLDGSTFRPTMVVEPRALPANATIQTFVAELEEGFKARYLGYRSEQKRVFEISGRDAVEWEFRTVPIRSIGDRFLITVVVDSRKVYVLLGSGLFSSYPLDDYRQIAASLRFL